MDHARRRPTALLAMLVALVLGLAACGGEDTAGDVADETELGEDTAMTEDVATEDMATETDPNEGTSPDTDASAPSAVGDDEDDTAAFLDDPSYYVTENPTLTGTIQEVNESGFTLGGEGWQDVTVFVPASEETLSDLSAGTEASVFGELVEVQEGDLIEIAAQVQDQLGVSLDESTLQSFTGDFLLLPEELRIGGTQIPVTPTESS